MTNTDTLEDTMTTLADQTPAEIDAQLDDLSEQHFVHAMRAGQYQKLADEARAKGADSYEAKYNAPKYQETADEHAAKIIKLAEQIHPLNAEFTRRGGWTRAFLVVGNGRGHVHRNRSCTSCYAETRYHWMTAFSGMAEDQIVDAAGERACTYCYPTAPVEVLAKPTRMFSKDEVAAQQAREERATKKAAAAAAVITDPETGKVLFKTERAATNEVSRLLGNFFLYQDQGDRDQARTIVKALAAKQGVDGYALFTELVNKAQAKFRKEAIKVAKQNLAGKAPIMTQFAMDPANWHDSIRKIAKEEGLI